LSGKGVERDEHKAMEWFKYVNNLYIVIMSHCSKWNLFLESTVLLFLHSHYYQWVETAHCTVTQLTHMQSC